MPDLYRGPYGKIDKKRFYFPGMIPADKAFSRFKIKNLAPDDDELHYVAHFWHWDQARHTMFAWWDPYYTKECVIILGALLDQRQALEHARLKFPEVIPSPIHFRFIEGYHEALVYD